MRSTLLVAVGGAAGASTRWGVSEIVPVGHGDFPWATLLVNVVGCLLVGVAAQRMVRGSDLWHACITGGLGGLTTYSAFAVETRHLLDDGHSSLAFAYVAVSLVTGLGITEWARRPRR